MTRNELRIRISATLMANAAHDYPTRMDAVMAEVDRYLIEYAVDAEAEFAARLPEAIEAHMRATGAAIDLPPPRRFKSFTSPRWSDEHMSWYDGETGPPD